MKMEMKKSTLTNGLQNLELEVRKISYKKHTRNTTESLNVHSARTVFFMFAETGTVSKRLGPSLNIWDRAPKYAKSASWSPLTLRE